MNKKDFEEDVLASDKYHMTLILNWDRCLLQYFANAIKIYVRVKTQSHFGSSWICC